MTVEEIETVVIRETAAALGMEKEEEKSKIQGDSLMVSDLGAESIDFVDLTFRLEKSFEMKIPEGELFEAGEVQLEQLKIRDVIDYISNHHVSCVKE